MRRKTSILLLIIMFIGLLWGEALTSPATASTAADGSKSMVVCLRIEGLSKNIYYNGSLSVSYTDLLTVGGVVRSISGSENAPSIIFDNGPEGARIKEIDGLSEKSIGGTYQDGWMYSVNSTVQTAGIDTVEVYPGDDIVIFYGDKNIAGIQYPEVDLSRMMSEGIVKFTSKDKEAGENGAFVTTVNPVAGATVTWDSMKYVTDINGEIIIDSTGVGVEHYLQIERYNEKGLPTVLRFAPEFFVIAAFNDVPQTMWYYSDVMFASGNGLVNGVSNTDFAPDSAMNRAMFVTVLGRIAGVLADHTAESKFSDVVSDGWSVGFITWAADNGIVNGNGDGTFGQYQNITREQIVAILYRYAQASGYASTDGTADLTAFSDAGSVSPYAVTAMQWAVGNGIINGANGQLNPSGVATRAQAAAILVRYMKNFT
jgi:hypothetical protein